MLNDRWKFNRCKWMSGVDGMDDEFSDDLGGCRESQTICGGVNGWVETAVEDGVDALGWQSGWEALQLPPPLHFTPAGRIGPSI